MNRLSIDLTGVPVELYLAFLRTAFAFLFTLAVELELYSNRLRLASGNDYG